MPIFDTNKNESTGFTSGSTSISSIWQLYGSNESLVLIKFAIFSAKIFFSSENALCLFCWSVWRSLYFLLKTFNAVLNAFFFVLSSFSISYLVSYFFCNIPRYSISLVKRSLSFSSSSVFGISSFSISSIIDLNLSTSLWSSLISEVSSSIPRTNSFSISSSSNNSIGNNWLIWSS